MVTPRKVPAEEQLETEIRTDAPLYALEQVPQLLHHVKYDSLGVSNNFYFSPKLTPQVIDAERDAHWSPFDLGAGTEDWIYGEVTAPIAEVRNMFRGFKFRQADTETLLPEVFNRGNLIVSERVRDIIEAFAPGYCYFAPAQFLVGASESPFKTQYFMVLIRRAIYYTGPRPARHYKRKLLTTVVSDDTWSAFCENDAVQKQVFDVPIFLFDRLRVAPIFNAALYRTLKAQNVTGLIDVTEDGENGPTDRDPKLRGYDAVVPLDPAQSCVK